MTATLLDALSRIAGPDVFAAFEPVGTLDGLLPTEAEAIQNAVPKRQAEFAAGRRAARNALGALGVAPTALPVGQARAPAWPPGVVGSISHDAGWAAAIVARTSTAHGLGLDVADATPFPVHLRDQILHQPEEQALDDLDARIVFSAKEALFKALYPSVRSYFGFDAAVVAPNLTTGRFTATLSHALGPWPQDASFVGQIAVAEGRLLAVLVLPA